VAIFCGKATQDAAISALSDSVVEPVKTSGNDMGIQEAAISEQLSFCSTLLKSVFSEAAVGAPDSSASEDGSLLSSGVGGLGEVFVPAAAATPLGTVAWGLAAAVACVWLDTAGKSSRRKASAA
jgi:hypothetical protein